MSDRPAYRLMGPLPCIQTRLKTHRRASYGLALTQFLCAAAAKALSRCVEDEIDNRDTAA
jgi:hypothetical protein